MLNNVRASASLFPSSCSIDHVFFVPFDCIDVVPLPLAVVSEFKQYKRLTDSIGLLWLYRYPCKIVQIYHTQAQKFCPKFTSAESL